MKKVIITIFLFAVVNVSAQNKDWTGVFSHYVERFNPNSHPTAVWQDLRIESSNGKLVGVYSEGYNGDVRRRFKVKIIVAGNTAKVLYAGVYYVWETRSRLVPRTSMLLAKRSLPSRNRPKKASSFTIQTGANCSVRGKLQTTANGYFLLKKRKIL